MFDRIADWSPEFRPIAKMGLDNLVQVTTGDYEVIHSLFEIPFHLVLHDGFPSNRYHWLWDVCC